MNEESSPPENEGSNTPHEMQGAPKYVDITADIINDQVAREAIDKELRSSKRLGRIGLILILAGIIFVVLGYTGSISMAIKIPGMDTSISNASPGILCLLLGSILLYFSKPQIRVK